MNAPELAMRPALPHTARPRPARARYPNPRLVKIHYIYSVREAAQVLKKHPRTILAWIAEGLAIVERRRPFLMRGEDLRAFLTAKRADSKRPCKPGEMYCLRCRAPRLPAGSMADYHPHSDAAGNLQALCGMCFATMNQCVSRKDLARLRDILQIQVRPAR